MELRISGEVSVEVKVSGKAVRKRTFYIHFLESNTGVVVKVRDLF